jgi:hypothetical protein
MIGWVIVLAAWMVYAETEMPDRAYKCEFDNSCEVGESEGEA